MMWTCKKCGRGHAYSTTKKNEKKMQKYFKGLIRHHMKYCEGKELNNMDSKQRFTLTQADIDFIKTQFIHIVIGALLTWGTTVVGHFQYGMYAPYVALGWSFISGVVTKWVSKS